MTIITVNQKGNGIEAIKNFALAISWGWSFEQSFEFGSDQLDTKEDEEAYLIYATAWKTENLKVETKKMICDNSGQIINWETKLV